MRQVFNNFNRRIEYLIAVRSFIVAVIFAFTSLAISEVHEVAAGNCTIIAQFILLTASIFGIDYKLGSLKFTSPKPNHPNDHNAQSNQNNRPLYRKHV